MLKFCLCENKKIKKTKTPNAKVFKICRMLDSYDNLSNENKKKTFY